MNNKLQTKNVASSESEASTGVVKSMYTFSAVFGVVKSFLVLIKHCVDQI